MAFLDVTGILTDPDLCDSFTVLRRVQVIGSNGRVTTATSTFANIVGVVTMSAPNELDRRDDFQVATRSISIVGKFQLYGEATAYQPDIVVWRGDQYLVKQVDLYPQFGPGFYQAECSSMDKTDTNSVTGIITAPAFVLNNANNSSYIPLG